MLLGLEVWPESSGYRPLRDASALLEGRRLRRLFLRPLLNDNVPLPITLDADGTLFA